ncbi:NOX5 oxidase, partial [Mionectes macconnelli]|nr:NOX5 oxidase [Mionectes macconnelli]
AWNVASRRSRAMGTAEDAEWLRWVTKQFGSIAGKDKEISLEEFKSALQVKESFFAERFFALFDADGSGTISLEELLRALRLLVHGDQGDKLSFLFQVYDVDGETRTDRLSCSGSIEADELQLVLRWCLRESSVSLPEERLGDLTRALLEAADRDHSGSITFPELREQLEAFPELMENLTISAASWLKPPVPAERPRPRCLSRGYWHNHRGQLGCLGGFAALNTLLFVLAALRHRGLGPALMLARGCGQGLNLNCALLAVPMLRRCLTWLRSTAVAEALPLDQHVQCHQLVGCVVLALGVAHSGAHIANLARLAQRDGGPALSESLLWARPGGGGVAGTAPQTGLALLVLLLAMGTFSSPCVRRRGHFEVRPGSPSRQPLLKLGDTARGSSCTSTPWGVQPVSSGCSSFPALLLLQVTHLVIQRPPSFHFKPGDYVYLNVPAIASYEWHPFSISSAPEQPETLWLHIRSLGQWTNRLYEYFQQLESPSPELKPPGRSQSWAQVGGTGINSGQTQQSSIHSSGLDCFLDGPYGTPTRRIFLSEHAVLIGAGIGITPFASILQSIMYRWVSLESWELPRTALAGFGKHQVMLTQGGPVLQHPLGSCSVPRAPGGSSLGIINHGMGWVGRAPLIQLLISWIRPALPLPLPPVLQVFGKVAQEQVGKVQVFFCGSPALAKVVRGHCERFGFRFSRENF